MPTLWSRDTGQQRPCFDSSQLIITWISRDINDVPMVMVLLSDFSSYGVWHMDGRTNVQPATTHTSKVWAAICAQLTERLEEASTRRAGAPL